MWGFLTFQKGSVNSTLVSVDAQSEKGTPSSSSSKKGKKEVTSRIASLWKRVEDSKKKNKSAGKDPRYLKYFPSNAIIYS